MEQQRNDIGKLFQSAFEGHRAAPEREEWDMLQTSLQTRNFFKFNPFQFNIYYASTILCCFLVCVGMGSHYSYSRWKQASEMPKADVIQEPVARGDASLLQEIASLNKRLHEQEEQLWLLKRKATNGTVPNVLSFNSTDTARFMLVTPGATTEKPSSIAPTQGGMSTSAHDSARQTNSVHHHVDTLPKVKPRRTFYITKQDTIVQYDTLRLPRRRKRP